ncbi:hypothetical protein DFP85_105163 [Halomonas ventosae]|uniref:Uncharacterized protein n=1 Tax=Halomonas ventosae TaxID=229007 RepID=A0A4R6ZUV6_9GAMM|nr:hypothetical protein DFP85_105163 [Halomonas ventosae]
MPASRRYISTESPSATGLPEVLDTQLEEWEDRLEEGEVPRFGDLTLLESLARKVLAALRKKGLIASA